MEFGNVLLVWLFLVQASPSFAAPSTCIAVPAVSNCLAAINSSLTKTKSASSFCSSILGCTTTPTTTLTGTITSTSTQRVVLTWTQKEIATETTTYSTYTDSTTLSKPISTKSLTSTYTLEKFIVTTIKPKKREELLHPRDLAARATTSNAACSVDVQKKACSCIVTCPTTVTKDNRKTIKEKTTETSYQGTTVGITYTNTEYIPIPTTTTVLYVDSTTKILVATNTRTVKCTPSVANPSFYLYATNAPPVNNRYVQAYPMPWQRDIFPSHKDPHYTRNKDEASLFYLDDSSRLLTAGKDGTTYGQVDYFNDFELFSFLSRGDIQVHNYLYAQCTIIPPSGLYAGNYKELTCRTNGFWDNRYFQYCPSYDEYFNNGLVLGAERSPESPDCLDIVFLVIPACG